MNVGDIFRVYTTLARPPKYKIVLYTGIHFGTDLFLWFNTDARQDRPAQMPIAPRETPGISHDCFLDCGRVTTFPDYELDQAEYFGCVSGAFLIRVADEIAVRATTLTKGQRNSIAQLLRQVAGKG